MRMMQHNTIEIGKAISAAEVAASNMVCRLDVQGRFLYVSEALAKTFGLSEEQIIGRCISKVGLTDGQRSTILLSLVRLCAMGGKATVCEIGCSAGGLRKEFLMRFEPIKNEYGVVNGIIGIVMQTQTPIQRGELGSYGINIERAIEAASWDSRALAKLLQSLFESVRKNYVELVNDIESGDLPDAKRLTKIIWQSSKKFGVGYVAKKATEMEQAIRNGVNGQIEECIISLGMAISYFEMEIARLCPQRV